MKTFSPIWLISLYCLCNAITSNDGATPSQKLCGNSKCSVPISKAKTVLRYVGIKTGSVSFQKSEIVEVFSKQKNHWGIKAQGKFGNAPVALLREFKVLIPTRDLVVVSEDVATEPVKVETTKKVAADIAVEKTEEIPAGRGSLLSFPSMAAAQSVNGPNSLPTPSSPSYEVLDGTTVWLDPVPSVQSSPEPKAKEPPASQNESVNNSPTEPPSTQSSETTNKVPVSSSEMPDITSEVPVTSSEAPVMSGEAPVSSSEALVSSSEAPVSSSETPVSSSEAPVSSSEVPISSSEAPVSSNEAPVISSEAPVTSIEVPSTSDDMPAGSSEAPLVAGKVSDPSHSDSPATHTPIDSLTTPPAFEENPPHDLESSTEASLGTTVGPAPETATDVVVEANPEAVTETATVVAPIEEVPEAQDTEPSQPGIMSNILSLWSSDGAEQNSQEEESDGDDEDGDDGEDGDEAEEDDGEEGSTEDGSTLKNNNANSTEPTAVETDQSSKFATVAPINELDLSSSDVVENVFQESPTFEELESSFSQKQVDLPMEKNRGPRKNDGASENLKSSEGLGVEQVSSEQPPQIPSSPELHVESGGRTSKKINQAQEEEQNQASGSAEYQQEDKPKHQKEDEQVQLAVEEHIGQQEKEISLEEQQKLKEAEIKLKEDELKRREEEQEQKRQQEEEQKRLQEEQKHLKEKEQRRQQEEEQKRLQEEEQRRQREETQKRQLEEEKQKREEENLKAYAEEQELWRQNQEKQRLREEEMKRQRDKAKKAQEEAMQTENKEAQILEESKQVIMEEELNDNSLDQSPLSQEQEETSGGVFSWISGLFGGNNELESSDIEKLVPVEQSPTSEQTLLDTSPSSSSPPLEHHMHPPVWSADQQTMCSASEASCQMKTETVDGTGFLGLGIQTISLDVFLLRLAATAVALFMGAVSFYFLRKKHVDSGLVARINELEKQLFVASKEAVILREEASVVDTSINAEEINALKEELESSRLVRADLEEQVTTLERELEEATETGIELNKLLSETLEASKGKAHAGLAASVERLQQQLDSQRDKVDSLTRSLKATSAENENLKSLVGEGKEKISALEAELAAAAEIANNIRKDREEANLLAAQELQAMQGKLEEALSSKVLEESRLGSELSALKLKYETLRSSLSLRDAEVKALQDTLKELQSGNINADQLLDVLKVKAELEHAKNERDSILEKYNNEEQARKDMEDRIVKNEELFMKLEEKVNVAERNKEEAETRLAVLSNYFKEKEEQLQKELGLKEAIVAQHQGDESSVVKHLHLLQEEVSTYRAQNESLKQEILDQERDFKVQMATLEKKAHDNWMTARQAERRLEDSRQEAAQLRNRLTFVEKNNADPNSRLDANGEGGIASPVMMMPLPPLGDMETPPSLPPFMFSPPPYPPPFMPPPLPPHPMGRPPPLGRMSSPPPPLGQFSPPPPPYDRMDRSSRSPSPPPHRYHHRSPPPPEHWGAPVGATFRPVPKPSPKKPSEQRDPRGSIHSSGHSNESMDRSRENV